MIIKDSIMCLNADAIPYSKPLPGNYSIVQRGGGQGDKTVLQRLWQTLNCFDWDFTKKICMFRYTVVTTTTYLTEKELLRIVCGKQPIFPISKQLLKETRVIYTEYLMQSRGKAYFPACSKGGNIWHFKELFLALQPRVKKFSRNYSSLKLPMFSECHFSDMSVGSCIKVQILILRW